MNNTAANETWQELKLFISSTFKDMQSERDYLVRFVFPRIREELLLHHIYFIDIDLRWGITDESNVRGTCRTVIDECRPLFLGVLGGRYGFIPNGIQGDISITEDEIDYALSSIQNNNYVGIQFMFRNEQDTLSMRENSPGEFREPAGSETAKKLESLKQRIRLSGFPVCEYRAQWDDTNGTFIHLHEFGESVYRFVMSYVEKEFDLLSDKEFDSDKKVVDDVETELFIAQRNKFYIENGLEQSFSMLSKAARINKRNNVILVSGCGGIGKSAFLSRFIQKSQDQYGMFLFPVFVGITPDSRDLYGLLYALCKKMTAVINVNNPIPAELDQLVLYFQSLLTQAEKTKRLVLVIDGINQMNPENNALELNWLPRQLPDNICVVISTSADIILEKAKSRWHNITIIDLPGFNNDASKQLVKYYLERYQKKLTDSQMEIILSKEYAHVPLYLATFIEEIRLYGQYEKLTDFMLMLPGNTVSLLKWVIKNRIGTSAEFMDQNGHNISAALTEKFLTYLYISKDGLSEAELVDLLREYNFNGNIAVLIRQLRSFLAFHRQLICFYHDDIKHAISQLFIEHTDVKPLHAKLAVYFLDKTDTLGDQSYTGTSTRDYRQALYHLLLADDWRSLVSLCLHGFMDSYAKVESAEDIFRITHQIIDYFANLDHELKEEDENFIWQAGLCLLNVYNETASSISKLDIEIPHPIERAILEGRDEDVETLISAANNVGQVYMRIAAAALYSASGREDAAKEIEQIISEEYSALFRPEQRVLFNVLCPPDKPEKDSSEKKKSKNKESNDTKSQTKTGNLLKRRKKASKRADNTRKKKISTRIRIPALQYFMLTVTGANRWWYFALFFSISLAFIWFSPLNLIMWTDRLYDLIKGFFLDFLIQLLDLLLKVISGAIIIAFISSVCLLIAFFSESYIQKRSSEQLKAMTAYACTTSGKKQTRSFLRLLRYSRLLHEARMLDSFPTETEEVIGELVRKHIKRDRADEAGKLLSCMAVSGMKADSIVKVLSGLPDREVKNALLCMFSKSTVLSRTKKSILLDILYGIYGYYPPVSVLLAVISLPGKDDGVVEALNKFDQRIIASCLLRSKIPDTTKMNKKLETLRIRLVRMFQRQKHSVIYQKIRRPLTSIFVEPVSLEWYNILIRFCLLLIPALFIGVVLYIIGLFMLRILFMFGIAALSMCVIGKIWGIWSEFEEAGFIHKNNERFNFSDQESGRYSPLRLSTAVETALSVNLAAEPSSSKELLQRCDCQKNLILITAARLSMKKRQLLSAMLESSVSLEAVLPILKKDNGKTERRGKPQKRKRLEKQWNSVKPRKIDVLSSAAIGLLSAAICAGIMFGLGFLKDPWLQLMINKMHWYILAVSFVCALHRSLMALLAFITFILLGVLYSDNGLFSPNFGAFIFYVIPTVSYLFAHIMVQKFRGRKLMFPTAMQSFLEKFKAVLLGTAGVLGTVLLIFLLLKGDAFVKGVNANPGKDEYAALQSYSAVRLRPDSFPALGREDAAAKIDAWLSGQTEYQHYIYTRGKQANEKLLTANALFSFGYNDQAAECGTKAMEYSGWAYFKADGQTQEIPMALIVIYITEDSEAERLGIRLGDAIIAVKGRQIISVADLTKALNANEGGLEITINRDGTDMILNVKSQKLGINMFAFAMDFLGQLRTVPGG